jgi:hypothetical protein
MNMNQFHSFLFVALMSLSSIAFGQCEADFDFGTALWGASPDASVGEQFDVGYLNQPYADVFHVLVPTDASAIDPTFALPLDSVVLVSTTLIDTETQASMSLEDVGLSIVCNNLGTSPNPCTLPAGGQYCASLEGTPTASGVYEMSLEIQAYVTIFGIAVAQPYEFSGYIMDIMGEGNPDGISESVADRINWFPNPAEEVFRLDPVGVAASIDVRDLSGRMIHSGVSFANSTTVISVDGWQSGIYLVSWTTDFATKTTKMVVRNQ